MGQISVIISRNPGSALSANQQSDEWTRYDAIQDFTTKLLGEKLRMKLADLRAALSERTGNSEAFILGCLRLLAGYDYVRAVPKAKTYEFSLTSKGKMAEAKSSYAASFAHEIATQAERIGQLINHGPTVGSYREELLRELLQKHIPQRFHAATGFIYGRPKQLDIVIYDQIEYAPLFRAGNLVVVPPEAVRAVIEVKSTLTTQTLQDALKGLSEVKWHVYENEQPIFKGVFAYRLEGSIKGIVSTVKSFYQEQTLENMDETESLDQPWDPIDGICVLRQLLIGVDFTEMEAEGKAYHAPFVASVESSSMRDFQAARFFDRLARYLRYPFSGARTNSAGLGSMFGDQSWASSVDFIRDGLWGSYVFDEFQDHADRFNEELEIYRGWLEGRAWRPLATKLLPKT